MSAQVYCHALCASAERLRTFTSIVRSLSESPVVNITVRHWGERGAYEQEVTVDDLQACLARLWTASVLVETHFAAELPSGVRTVSVRARGDVHLANVADSTGPVAVWLDEQDVKVWDLEDMRAGKRPAEDLARAEYLLRRTVEYLVLMVAGNDREPQLRCSHVAFGTEINWPEPTRAFAVFHSRIADLRRDFALHWLRQCAGEDIALLVGQPDEELRARLATARERREIASRSEPLLLRDQAVRLFDAPLETFTATLRAVAVPSAGMLQMDRAAEQALEVLSATRDVERVRPEWERRDAYWPNVPAWRVRFTPGGGILLATTPFSNLESFYIELANSIDP